jgi:hypothetical protein
LLDFIKDSTEAWLQRIRSPIIGSIALAFVACNWKPIWYLLFADQTVTRKFIYFDMNTSAWWLYFWPIVIGLAIALASPWIKLVGSWVAANPTRKLRNFQSSEASQHRILRLADLTKEEEMKADFEEARAATIAKRETRTIEAAKRLDEASKVDDGSAKEEIIKERETSENAMSVNSLIQLLSAREAAIIVAVSQISEKVRPFQISDSAAQQLKAKLSGEFGDVDSIRLEAEITSAFETFKSFGLATSDSQGYWRLTAKGYQVSETI